MVKKIITWVDTEGRYRVTSPAYDNLLKSHGFDEDEAIAHTWIKIADHYGISIDHPHHYVEDADQRTKVAACCGNDFRYGALRTGANGDHDARDGAWEMDTDGTPKVNMAKARGVHMDVIRLARNTELAAKDVTFMRAVEAGDASAQSTLSTEKQTLRDIPQTFDLTTDTPEQLKALWPTELPARE